MQGDRIKIEFAGVSDRDEHMTFILNMNGKASMLFAALAHIIREISKQSYLSFKRILWEVWKAHRYDKRSTEKEEQK